MKKIISLLIAAMLVMSLAACGADSQSSSGNSGSSDNPSSKTENVGEPEVGTVTDGVYENKSFNIGCKPAENYTIYNDEQLGELMGISADMFSDEAVKKAMEESGTYYDFFAQDDEAGKSMNVCVEKMKKTFGKTMSESEYITATVDQLPEIMQDAGFENVTVEKTTTVFAGETREALASSATVQGMNYYTLQVLIKYGDYMASVTATSYIENTTEDIIKSFYNLGMAA